MIFLGRTYDEKINMIESLGGDHVVWIGSCGKPDIDGVDFVPYNECDEFVYYYRLLREIGDDTVLVIDECLQNSNRYDLKYNCIRLYIQQTENVFIFNWLPVVSNREDFMILFDFDTRSQWKRYKFDEDLIGKCGLSVVNRFDGVSKVDILVGESVRKRYESKKKSLFDGLGSKDPHTLPRNLHVWGNSKKSYASNRPEQVFFARNQRFKLDNVFSINDKSANVGGVFLDIPHKNNDICNYLRRTRSSRIEFVCRDLPVDEWYFGRLESFNKEVQCAYASLQQYEEC